MSPEKPCCNSLEVNVTDNSNEKVQGCVREKNVKLSQSDQICELIKKIVRRQDHM